MIPPYSHYKEQCLLDVTVIQITPNSGSESCSARVIILPCFFRTTVSSRQSGSNHSVSKSCHRFSCGMRGPISPSVFIPLHVTPTPSTFRPLRRYGRSKARQRKPLLNQAKMGEYIHLKRNRTNYCPLSILVAFSRIRLRGVPQTKTPP